MQPQRATTIPLCLRRPPHPGKRRIQLVETTPSQRPESPHGRAEQEMPLCLAVEFNTSGSQRYVFVVYRKVGKFYMRRTPSIISFPKANFCNQTICLQSSIWLIYLTREIFYNSGLEKLSLIQMWEKINWEHKIFFKSSPMIGQT